MLTAIIILPLVAFLIAGLGERWIGARGCQTVTSGLTILTALLSLRLIWTHILPGELEIVSFGSWMAVGDLSILWSLRFDALSITMLNVVTIVSACVHVYSIGYMEDDPAKGRFMAYLSLFTFAMLVLVSANNLLQLFIGWEGVGLTSYLLIGFYNQKESACNASIKAFVMNRVGDFGIMVALFALFLLFGTMDFSAIFESVSDYKAATFELFGFEFGALNFIGLMLFVAAVGKSAQLGLHTWLPDAMEGPTPVSALIHAATMVTAGIVLIARFSPLYEYAPVALVVITIFGALTSIVAATIALTQFDIKRVIAYSTMSQLGYMVFALGVSAYGAAMFHLVTHAFFKALLFLGAGSVIHAAHHEQDMRKMGQGMWRHLPVTYAFMIIGSLALTGMPFFAGYYSKDMVLEVVFADHSWFGTFAFWIGIVVAFLTAFYSWRLILLTFHDVKYIHIAKEEKVSMRRLHHLPKVMQGPCLILVLGALFSGALLYPYFVGDHDTQIWQESIMVLPENDTVHDAHHVPKWVKKSPVIAGLLGTILAIIGYGFVRALTVVIPKLFAPLDRFFAHKWFFDHLYRAVFLKNSLALGRMFTNLGDRMMIDGLGPDGVSRLSKSIGRRFSKVQNGLISQYVLIMVISLIGFVLYFVKRGAV